MVKENGFTLIFPMTLNVLKEKKKENWEKTENQDIFEWDLYYEIFWKMLSSWEDKKNKEQSFF